MQVLGQRQRPSLSLSLWGGGRREPRHTQASGSVTRPVCVLKGSSVPSSEFC